MKKGRFIYKAPCILQICFRDIIKVCSTQYVEIDNASDWPGPATLGFWLADTELSQVGNYSQSVLSPS